MSDVTSGPKADRRGEKRLTGASVDGARVPYERWLAFMWLLLLILTLFIMAALSGATFL